MDQVTHLHIQRECVWGSLKNNKTMVVYAWFELTARFLGGWLLLEDGDTHFRESLATRRIRKVSRIERENSTALAFAPFLFPFRLIFFFGSGVTRLLTPQYR